MLILIDALYEPRPFYSLHAFGWRNWPKQGKFQIGYGVCMTFFCHAALHQPAKFLSILLKVWVHVGGLGGGGGGVDGGQTSVNYSSLVCCHCVLNDLYRNIN